MSVAGDKLKRVLSTLLVLISLFALFAGFAGLAGCTGEQERYFVEFSLSENFYVDGEPLSSRAHAALEREIGGLLNEIEDAVSVERGDSDVSRINAAAAGEEVVVSDCTFEMLTLAKQYFSRTGGAFSAALYGLSELWGFTPEFEGRYTLPRPEPSEEEISAALSASDFEDIVLREGNVVVKRNADTRIDLGGIAKGYMSDAAAELIRAKYEGSALDGYLKVMSNTVLFGENADKGRGWTSSVENPRVLTTGVTEALYAKDLSDVAISCSADTYRFYVYDGRIYSHIIDGSTGKPSSNGIICICVFVPLSVPNAGAAADALSTAGYCMPLTQALDLYSSLAEEGVSAVVICADFKYYVTGGADILGREEFGQTGEVFVRAEIEDASDDVFDCEQELEYIRKVEEYTAR